MTRIHLRSSKMLLLLSSLALCFAAVPALSSQSLAAVARSGNEGPHGGDFVAIEFVTKAHEVLDLLARDANKSLLTPAQLQALTFAIQNTPVNSTESDDTVLYDQDRNAVDAVTVEDPTSSNGKHIILQRARWLAYLQNKTMIHKLVLHEYLNVIGVDDQDPYPVSSRLVLTPPPVTPPVTPPSPPPSTAPMAPLMVTVSGGVTTLIIYLTDQPGNSGSVAYSGGTQAVTLYLNPARLAFINLNGGTTTIFYDRRLSSNLQVTRQGGTVDYRYLQVEPVGDLPIDSGPWFIGDL